MRKMRSPASSTICGTHGAKKNVKSCLEECAGIFGENGTHKQKSPSMVRRNSSTQNCQKITKNYWWSVPYRFMTARLLEKSLMILKFWYAKNVVQGKWRYRGG